MDPAIRPQQLRTPLSTIPGLYAEFKPTEFLRRYVACYWLAPYRLDASNPGVELVEPLVPDGCIDLVISKEHGSGTSHAWLIGTLSAPTWVSMRLDQLQTFGIRLYPGGLRPFLREPAHLFTDRIDSLADVSPLLWQDLAVILEQAETLEGVLTAVDRLLSARLRDAAPIPLQNTLQGAIHILATNHHGLSIRELARHLAISERHLLRLFLEQTGLTPKQFAKMIRFQRALSLLHRHERLALSEIALSCGYYDQAHFTREFVSLSGITPGRYANSGGFVQDLSGH